MKQQLLRKAKETPTLDLGEGVGEGLEVICLGEDIKVLGSEGGVSHLTTLTTTMTASTQHREYLEYFTYKK